MNLLFLESTNCLRLLPLHPRWSSLSSRLESVLPETYHQSIYFLTIRFSVVVYKKHESIDETTQSQRLHTTIIANLFPTILRVLIEDPIFLNLSAQSLICSLVSCLPYALPTMFRYRTNTSSPMATDTYYQIFNSFLMINGQTNRAIEGYLLTSNSNWN